MEQERGDAAGSGHQRTSRAGYGGRGLKLGEGGTREEFVQECCVRRATLVVRNVPHRDAVTIANKKLASHREQQMQQ